MEVAELERAVAAAGFRPGAGRPSKEISDALRWEVARGRAVRLGRGRYAAGRVADVTRHRMRRRIDTARRLGHGAHLAAWRSPHLGAVDTADPAAACLPHRSDN